VSLFNGEAEAAERPHSPGVAVGIAEVSHAEIRDRLSDFLESSPDERDRARVEEHLAHCRSCRAYQRTLEATRGALSKLPRAKAPESAKQRLLGIPDA
jgi:anti-sigma factor RsiW